jgi:hypothetical protein
LSLAKLLVIFHQKHSEGIAVKKDLTAARLRSVTQRKLWPIPPEALNLLKLAPEPYALKRFTVQGPTGKSLTIQHPEGHKLDQAAHTGPSSNMLVGLTAATYLLTDLAAKLAAAEAAADGRRLGSFRAPVGMGTEASEIDAGDITGYNMDVCNTAWMIAIQHG